MRRTALMKRAGPYRAASRADGSILLTPEWPVDSDPDGDRGPGLFSRMGLAHDIEAFLNAPYSPSATTAPTTQAVNE